MPDTSGRLAPDRFGFSMPVTDPPVDGPPYSCRGFGVMALADDAAAAIVPEGLTIAHSPAIAQLIFTDFHFSTLGADIAADPRRAVPVGAAPMAYCASLLTTDEVNLIGGREPSGLPGLFGNVEWVEEHEIIWAFARPAHGRRICTGVLRPPGS